MILEAANTGSFDDPRGKVWSDKSFRDMLMSPMMTRFMMWLASNFPFWFYRNIVLPDLSLFDKKELDREVKYAKTIPDFRENFMMKFAES